MARIKILVALILINNAIRLNYVITFVNVFYKEQQEFYSWSMGLNSVFQLFVTATVIV